MLKYIIFYTLCYLVTNVCCDCYLEIPENKDNKPYWEKKIGNSWFKIPYITSRFKMQNDEMIKGYCATRFKTISYIVEVERHCEYYDYSCKSFPKRNATKYLTVEDRNMTIQCVAGSLKFGLNVLENSTISCNELEWIINVKPANSQSQVWCKEYYQIYELATKNLEPNRTLANVCYDLKEFSLQSIKYKTINRRSEEWKVNRLLPNIAYNPDSENTPFGEVKFLITTLLHTGNDSLRNHLNALSVENPWLKLANYEYGSIIQTGLYLNYFKHYHHLLDILWWHNLRVANWARFLNALEQHTANNSYEVCLGILGVVQVPLWPDQREFENLEVENGFVNSTVPQYIWAFLETTTQDMKKLNVYVFGYNSPYAEFFNANDVKFCRDVCNEIDWLRSVRSSFGFVNFGLVFCCTPDAVRKSIYGESLPRTLAYSDSVGSIEKKEYVGSEKDEKDKERQERQKEREEKEKEREREEKERERQREREEKDKEKRDREDKERQREKEKEEKEREREKDKEREREKAKEMEREKEKERAREQVTQKDKVKETEKLEDAEEGPESVERQTADEEESARQDKREELDTDDFDDEGSGD
uniref:Uncharacterized protein n=1 Tax=Glossina pallidipes TaxID=7398 RepID=A0A1A9ZCU6_GLOPL